MSTVSLNELNLENIGQWPLPVKIGAVVGLSLLVIAMGYWLIVKANFESYDNLQKEEKTLRTEFETKQLQAANLQAYKNQIQIIRKNFICIMRSQFWSNLYSHFLCIVGRVPAMFSIS